jgi:cell wall-associated NlpC family hydrolase
MKRNLAFVIFCLLPAAVGMPRAGLRPRTPDDLRRAYVARMAEHEGTPYAVTGDSTGLSCSALVCQAFADVAFAAGYTRGDDRLLRVSEWLRTNPCLAEQLRHGCAGHLSPVQSAVNIQLVDYGKLLPGDVAVVSTSVGAHTLAYLGGGVWIQATAADGRVVKTHARAVSRYWFARLPVSVLRWNELAAE